MRILTPAEIAVLSGPTAPLALLVEMDLPTPLYMTSGGVDLAGIDGKDYLGMRGLGRVEPVRTTSAEIAQLRFELSGVPSTHIALAESEDVQGKAVRMKLGIFNPSTYQILGARLFWAGKLDLMNIVDGPKFATIDVTAEHDGVTLLHPLLSLYSDAEQQRLFPGDLFFQYIADQVDQRIVWPAASWGRQ